MNIILQDTEWNKCTEQEQQNILEIYNKHPEWLDVINALEDKFGKHNLRPEPKFKTWEDIQKMNEDSNFYLRVIDNLELPDKIYSKCIATLKIAKLIELGYGGMISNEEWEDIGCKKYAIDYVPCNEGKFVMSEYCIGDYRFIAFHTNAQRINFMSHQENVELIKQYYMI